MDFLGCETGEARFVEEALDRPGVRVARNLSRAPFFQFAREGGVFSLRVTIHGLPRDGGIRPQAIGGDTLIIGGRVVTDRLRTDASVAGQTVDRYALGKYAALKRELEEWRAGQISGDAYAGTIKSFLNDPRLAGFTPEEIHRAYLRIFGRDLKTDINADRISAKEGRPITYAEMMASSR